MNRYLRLPDVIHKTGVSRSTIYKLIAKGEFPRPHRLTSRTVGWGDSEVEAWMDTRQAAPLQFRAHWGRRASECMAKRSDPDVKAEDVRTD